MSYCLKNVPGTYGLCALSSGHRGPCSVSRTRSSILCPECRNPLPDHKPDCRYEWRKEYNKRTETGNRGIPQSDPEAERYLRSFSIDHLITNPAIKDFHTRRALGESVESAYRGALEFMIRRVG